jgi:hypothetical protein
VTETTAPGTLDLTASGSAELRAAAAALKERIDAWVTAVETVGAAADDGAEALDDPRLEAAEEEFEAAVAGFHKAAGPVLGLDEDDDDEDADLEVEELALHLLVGVPEGAADPARDAATIVHEAGERLVGQLTSAGYQVPAWQFGCEVELLLDDDEDE